MSVSISRTDPELLAAARGDAPADLVLTGGRVVNVFTRELVEADIAITGGRIAGVGSYADAKERVDVSGSYLAPGLIDAHMHIESTMMTPPEFVRAAAPHGTTGVVLDPHEIANVLGVPGIRYLMEAAEDLPMDIMFMVSSCVPSSPLETAGATLHAEDLAPLFDDERVMGLAEMMNFPGAAFGDAEVLKKIRQGLESGRVDGHCPGMTGHMLQAYCASGVSSDHECTSAAEALEKMRCGMRVYIREGSAARNLEALIECVSPANAHLFSFCTDDRHPADLIADGHINNCLREAVARGLDPLLALAMGSLHPAEHYRRDDLGAIAPGRFADLMVLDDLKEFRPRQVYFRGALIAENGSMRAELPAGDALAAPARGETVRIDPGLSGDSLRVAAPAADVQIRVIEMLPGQIVTGEIVDRPREDQGALVSDVSKDILKMAVIERHRGSGAVGLGFVRGFAMQRGAIASTVGHDAHNLICVGTNDEDMVIAARALARCGGGQSVVIDGEEVALLELPIAGLISDAPGDRVAKEQQALLVGARKTGCPIEDPFMPLSFLALPVIPKLKLTDLGLVDVNEFAVVGLEATR